MCKQQSSNTLPTDFLFAFDPFEKRNVRIIKMTKDQWGNDQVITARLCDGAKNTYYPGQLSGFM